MSDFIILQNNISNQSILTIDNTQQTYYHVASFHDIQFSYGFCKDGWVIKQRTILLIPWTSTNFLPFLKLLELPFDEIKFNISKTLIDLNKISWIEYFPITEMTLTAFNMQSDYWSTLCINFLLQSKFSSNHLVQFFKEKVQEKWVSQTLKHKIRKL